MALCSGLFMHYLWHHYSHFTNEASHGLLLTACSCCSPALTEHAQFMTIPTEGLDFKSRFPVIFPDSRFLILPQLFTSTRLFPTPSLPLALISTFSSLPLTFMSSTRQRQDRTDIRESSFKKKINKTEQNLWSALACSEPFGEKHICVSLKAYIFILKSLWHSVCGIYFLP